MVLPGGRLGSKEQVVMGFRMVLEGLGLDLSSPHLAQTPERTARAWWNELCQGLTHDPPTLTTFPAEADEMVLLRNIPIHSLCAHHLLPFYGKAAIAYIPGKGQILGLSKLSRVANHWARRPQVQEELTSQIADHLASLVVGKNPETGEVMGGVGVVIRANHLCMMLRGVKHSGDMVTSAVRGIFLTQSDVRAEFLRLANGGE